MADESDDTLEMNRRNILKALGAGVSLSAVDLLSEDEAQIGDITYNPEEEVPYVAGYDYITNENGEFVGTEPHYEAVPKEKWNKQRATDEVMEKTRSYIQDLVDDPEEPIWVAIRGDEESTTGERVDVLVEDRSSYTADQLDDELPDTLTGSSDLGEETFDIDISAEEFEGTANSCTGSCDYSFSTQHTDVPAGAAIAADTDDWHGGTVGAAYYHPTHGDGWLTAGHVLKDEGNFAYEMEDSNPENSIDALGEAEDVVLKQWNSDLSIFEIDVGYIRPTSNETPHPWISTPDYTDNEDVPVAGRKNNNALRTHLDDEDWTVNTQGFNSCRDSSYITAFTKHQTDEVQGVAVDHSTGNGDSGGPMLHIDNNSTCGDANDDAYICGIIAHNWDIDDDFFDETHGPTAETIDNELGGYFMAP